MVAPELEFPARTAVRSRPSRAAFTTRGPCLKKTREKRNEICPDPPASLHPGAAALWKAGFENPGRTASPQALQPQLKWLPLSGIQAEPFDRTL
jgi:hypothetical protein